MNSKIEMKVASRLDCKHFGVCGGCDLLDRSYPEQLEWKQKKVAAAFAKYPALRGIRMGATTPAPEATYYRNRLIYPLAMRGGEVVGGFFKKGTHELVDVEMCRVQEPPITELAGKIKKILGEMKFTIQPMPGISSDGSDECDFEAETVAGKAAAPANAAIRALAIRLIPGTEQVLVGFVTTGGLFPQGRELADRVVRAAEGIPTRVGRPLRVVGVLRNINDKSTNVVFGPSTMPLLGKDFVTTTIGRFQFSMDLTAFFQPNPVAALRAAQYITKSLPANLHRVVDAYAGSGFFAMHFAIQSMTVTAIEEAPASARAGKRNLQLNRIGNIQFIAGAVEEYLKTVPEGEMDLLFTDPPRAGLSESALQAIVRARPRNFYYLSCSEVTLARDLAKISELYEIEEVTPFDFLPQTAHVEVFARTRLR